MTQTVTNPFQGRQRESADEPSKMALSKKTVGPGHPLYQGMPGDEAAGDAHPSCGLIEELMTNYLSGELSRSDAVQRFGKILDLYPVQAGATPDDDDDDDEGEDQAGGGGASLESCIRRSARESASRTARARKAKPAKHRKAYARESAAAEWNGRAPVTPPATSARESAAAETAKIRDEWKGRKR